MRSLPSGQRLDVALADLEADLTTPPDGDADGAVDPASLTEASATAADRQAEIEQFIRFGHDHLALDL